MNRIFRSGQRTSDFVSQGVSLLNGRIVQKTGCLYKFIASLNKHVPSKCLWVKFCDLEIIALNNIEKVTRLLFKIITSLFYFGQVLPANTALSRKAIALVPE